MVQFSSVTRSCPTLCDPMDCSTPGFPVHHQVLELAQTHIYQALALTDSKCYTSHFAEYIPNSCPRWFPSQILFPDLSREILEWVDHEGIHRELSHANACLLNWQRQCNNGTVPAMLSRERSLNLDKKQFTAASASIRNVSKFPQSLRS